MYSAPPELRRLRSTPAEKIFPRPVSTIALISALRRSLKRAARASQNSMSSALALPWVIERTATPSTVLVSIMPPAPPAFDPRPVNRPDAINAQHGSAPRETPELTTPGAEATEGKARDTAVSQSQARPAR